MSQNFNISIITPFYNGNKYIEQLFLVVEKNCQTLKKEFPNAEIELVLVNDSPEIEVELPTTTYKFQYKIINHKTNSGIHQARVTGLCNCSGDYILFLDQDDVLNDDAILSQWKMLLVNKADMVICNAYIEMPDGRYYELYKSKTDFKRINELQFYLKSHNVIKSPGQCLIKRSCIPKEWLEYKTKNNGSDDLFLWILLFEKSYKFIVNNNVLYTHKYTGENLSESESKMSISSLEIVDLLKQIDYIPQKDIKMLKRSREFRMELSHSHVFKKIIIIIKNINLILYLTVNKLKKILY